MDITLSHAAIDIAVNLKLNKRILLVGPVGVGKTDVAKQAADAWALAEHGVAKCPIIDRRVSQMQGTDVQLPFPNASDGMIDTFIPRWLPDLKRDGPFGVLLLDEYTDGKNDILAALNQLNLEGRLGDYVFLDGWRIIATGNRQKDKANAQKISRASANRFVVMSIMVDVKAWINWAMANGICPELISYVQTVQMQLATAGKPESDAIHHYPDVAGSDAIAFLTPRSLARCNDYFPLNLPDTELRRQLSYNVGDDCANSIMNHLQTYRLMPDLNAILADPLNATVHREPSLNYILGVGLVSQLTYANLPAIASYIKRLSAGYQSVFWSNAKAKDAGFEKTSEHVSYLISQAKE